jgi:hypothetical protein
MQYSNGSLIRPQLAQRLAMLRLMPPLDQYRQLDHRSQPIPSPNVQALISESFLSLFEWLNDLMGALHEKLDYGAARSILQRNH